MQLVKLIAAALIALVGCGAAIGMLLVWLVYDAPRGNISWIAGGSFVLAALSLVVAALVAEVKIEE